MLAAWLAAHERTKEAEEVKEFVPLILHKASALRTVPRALRSSCADDLLNPLSGFDLGSCGS